MGNRRRVGEARLSLGQTVGRSLSRGTHRRSQEACRLSDPIEARRVKKGRLEHVPNEPLAFDATVAGLRPGPWGGSPTTRVAIITGPRLRSFTLSPTLISIPGTFPGPEFDIGHKTYAANLAKGSVLITGAMPPGRALGRWGHNAWEA
jgi:hypothetical protein